jgi:hypothetical protein
MSVFKTRYKIYKNPVLFMMIELDRGCAHLIFPYGCVAVFEAPTVVQLPTNNFTDFYVPRRFITLFTTAFILMLSSLRLRFPTGSLLLALPQKSYTHSSSSHSCQMLCPSHLGRNHFNSTWRRVQVTKLLVM